MDQYIYGRRAGLGFICDGEYRQCRGETYSIEQGMSAQESEAFGTEMGNRLADDIEAGGDKDMGDILDDMGVPAYKEEC